MTALHLIKNNSIIYFISLDMFTVTKCSICFLKIKYIVFNGKKLVVFYPDI